MMETKVNKAVAVFFRDQCIGSYSGHMSNIPNNPVLSGLFDAHFGKGRDHSKTNSYFSDFLRQVLDQLENNNE